MKLASYMSSVGPRACLVRETEAGPHYLDLNENDPRLPSSLAALLEAGADAMDRARELASEGAHWSTASVRFLAPIPRPRKILCVGANYADHASESQIRVGREPIIFNKLPTTLCGDQDPIVLPAESDQVDFEAELVVVIGREGKHIPRERVDDHIGGYTCGNDISARDWQKGKPGKQWLLGKSFDHFGPTGPYLVTPDELGPSAADLDLAVELRLNGQVMQAARTRQLVFGVDYLVAYLSAICTLEPGDLIFTGTPSGVGAARIPPIFLKPGDTTEVEIEGIGVLQNSIVG